MSIYISPRIRFSLPHIVGFFLAVAPVMDPYLFCEVIVGFSLKVNDIFMIPLSILCFFHYGRDKFKTDYLCMLIFGLFLITVLANIASSTDALFSLKVICIWSVYSICLMYIWKTPCRNSFFIWIRIIAVISSIVVLLQFIAGYLGIAMWDGKLPLFELGKYDGWAGYIDKNTGNIRPNGIFQEASYVGIFLSVAYISSLQKGDLLNIVLFSVAMILTTSIISVVLWGVITAYAVIAWKDMRISSKTIKDIFYLGVLAFIAFVVLVNLNDSLAESVRYIFNRFDNLYSDLSGIRMSSAKYRLIGHVELYSLYNDFQKFVGVGAAQYAKYWDVKSYSNVWVTIVLDYGILGLLVVSSVLVMLFERIRLENRVYFVVLLLIFSSDYQWYSWYFFYLLTACVLKTEVNK